MAMANDIWGATWNASATVGSHLLVSMPLTQRAHWPCQWHPGNYEPA